MLPRSKKRRMEFILYSMVYLKISKQRDTLYIVLWCRAIDPWNFKEDFLAWKYRRSSSFYTLPSSLHQVKIIYRKTLSLLVSWESAPTPTGPSAPWKNLGSASEISKTKSTFRLDADEARRSLIMQTMPRCLIYTCTRSYRKLSLGFI